MDTLNGFRLAPNENNAKLFVTIKGRLANFSKGTSEILGSPANVHIFIDEENGRFALKPCQEDAVSYSFYQKPKDPDSQVFMRLTLGKWLPQMAQNLGLDIDQNRVRVYGEYAADENAVIFDFHNASKPREFRRK